MASLDSIIPPSTHCSAAMSCGGVRSKPESPYRSAGTLPPSVGPGERSSSVTDTGRTPIAVLGSLVARGCDTDQPPLTLSAPQNDAWSPPNPAVAPPDRQTIGTPGPAFKRRC